VTDAVGAPSRLPLVLGALAVAGAGFLRVADPHDAGLPLPGCPTKRITGLDCPGCGGMRMANDLLHGDVRRAATDNLWLLVTGPLLVGLALRWARARRQGRSGRVPRRLGLALAGGAGAWMVVRNLPAWPLRPTTSRGVTSAA
jgi:hypothetical protein